MRIETHQAGKRYGDSWGIREVSLTIPQGAPLLFLGPSGGGKSTLLRLLAGLEIPDEGEIWVDGHPLPKDEASLRSHRRRLGFVFQEGNLFPHLTAEENITLPLCRAHGHSPEKARARAQELLQRFQLLPHAEKRPAELSGGQRQRVALARALGHNPEILLLDEPTAGVDPVGSASIGRMIHAMRDKGKTVVLCSHLLGQVEQVCDRVAIMDRGKLVLEGAVEDVLSRRDRHVMTIEAMTSAARTAAEAALEAHGAKITSVTHPRRSLEDLFRELVNGSRDA
jgi:polar amino acid transport system ATP-binding protein